MIEFHVPGEEGFGENGRETLPNRNSISDEGFSSFQEGVRESSQGAQKHEAGVMDWNALDGAETRGGLERLVLSVARLR